MRILKTRTVLLLGRRPAVSWNRVRDGLRRDDELVVLSIGCPVTGAQRTALLEAQTLAERVGAWFDALLITSTKELLSALQPDDEVHVAARGFEGRKLRRALATPPS